MGNGKFQNVETSYMSAFGLNDFDDNEKPEAKKIEEKPIKTDTKPTAKATEKKPSVTNEGKTKVNEEKPVPAATKQVEKETETAPEKKAIKTEKASGNVIPLNNMILCTDKKVRVTHRIPEVIKIAIDKEGVKQNRKFNYTTTLLLEYALDINPIGEIGVELKYWEGGKEKPRAYGFLIPESFKSRIHEMHEKYGRPETFIFNMLLEYALERIGRI